MAEEKEIERMSKKLDGVADDVRTLTYRADKIEHKVDGLDSKVDGIENKLDAGFNAVFQKLEIISGHLTSVVGKVTEHETRLNNVDRRLAVLEGEPH
jgi:uncharacterized protein YoxC